MSENRSGIGKYISTALRYLIPLAITVLLVWYMFTKIDFAQLWHTVRHGVDYKWILLAMVISVFSHVFRAMRWRLQLRAMDVHPSLMALSCSIFGTYALNLVFPRLGEVWRCTYISQRQRTSLTGILGSMVADRLADTLTVLLLLLLTLVVANRQIMAFLNKYPIGQDMVQAVSSPMFWAAVVAVVALGWLGLYLGRNTTAVKKLKRMTHELWDGFATVGRMKGRGAFGLYTVAIWGCYYLQLYTAFYAFDCTRALCFEPGLAAGLLPCLVTFVLSSIGMAVPSNGGLGPWNMAVVFGLMLYAVPEGEAASMSIVVWSAQTIMLIILGIFTAIYISTEKRDVRIIDAKID